MYRSGLLSRRLTIFGVIGGPLVMASGIAVLFGVIEAGSTTQGRIGLRPPVAGDKFGMLRLTTIRRRSGQPRVAIVGYYENGANLVTLAMNDWAARQSRHGG